MRPRPLLLSCVSLVAALLLAGCTSDPAEVVGAASATTRKAGSSKMAIDIIVTGQAVPAQQVRITGEGAYDYDDRKGTITLRLPLTAGGPPTEIQSVIDGDVQYQRLPPELSASLPGGKPWIKLDLGKLDASPVSQGQSADPTKALQFLEGVTGEVTDEGKEDVRGEETTHYKGTIDLGKAAEAADDRAALDQLIKQQGTRNLPVDVWIDGDGRMRRMRYQLDVKGTRAAQQGAPVKLTVGLELFEFGIQVDATPPPAGQVQDASGLLGGGTSGTGTGGGSGGGGGG